MDFLVPALFLFTFGIVIVLAIVNRRQTKNLEEDPTSGKSSLAADGDPHQNPEKSPGYTP